MRPENDVSAAHATDVAKIDCTKLKTRSCKHIWIVTSSRQLDNVLICPADVATNRLYKRNESYNE